MIMGDAVLNETGPDAGVPWHYGDPLREQRRLTEGSARVDLSHLPVFAVSGPDRLTWLHALTSQAFEGLAAGEQTSAYILDPQGHVEHAFTGVDDGDTFWAFTEPGHLDALLAWLRRMVFASRVEVVDASETHAVVGLGLPASAGVVSADTDANGATEDARDTGAPAGVGAEPRLGYRIVPRGDLAASLGELRAGTWASEALRIASGQPRPFLDTDERTIPNEVASPDGDRLGAAVHLKKGCYRGQETVARVHTLGRPPRRLTLLHFDGSDERLPEVGADVLSGDKVVGRMGTSSIHHVLGPIGLALLKRTTPLDAPLIVDGLAAAQETLVDPEVGLHVRPRLR